MKELNNKGFCLYGLIKGNDDNLALIVHSKKCQCLFNYIALTQVVRETQVASLETAVLLTCSAFSHLRFMRIEQKYPNYTISCVTRT